MSQLLVLPGRITDSNNVIVPNARRYSYLTGTLTPAPTYTTAALSVSHGAYVQANSAGLLPPIYLDPAVSYRFKDKTALGVDIPGADYDPVTATSASEILFTPPGTGAVPRPLDEKLAESISITDFGADPTGVVDCTAAFQNAINQASVTFPPGDYTMSYTAINADVSIPGNRKITVEKGATITMTGGRFAAENVDNVEWQIDGWVKSVAMRTATARASWSAIPYERGFIEFGEVYVAASAASGFTVHGTGIVSGDWTGTPNVTDLSPYQVNRKGIACWNARNVLISGLEVFGFDGEAVFAYFFDEASHNIVFEGLNVHDTRFNALNFNGGANGGGCHIRHNRAENAYSVEASAGEVTDNYVEGMIASGIWTGAGGGGGPIVISRNTIKNAGLHGIATIFASGTPVTGVKIENNTITTTAQYGIFADYVREFTIKGNIITGNSSGSGSYAIGVNHTLRGHVANNTFMSPGGFSVGFITVDNANCFDISVDPESNVYTPTTGTVPPYVGNGVQSVASAAAVTLPTLGSIFTITGTTNITSIDATGNSGRKVTLIFADILTFTDGSDLKLAGNLVTTADDTISLVCDGTNWFEVCRSVN